MNNFLRRKSFVLHKKSQNKQTCILNTRDKNWINRYVEISTHLCFGDYDETWFEDVHFDVLRDLYNESFDNDIIIHLLSLLELMTPMLNSENKIEQTIGSLLNIFEIQKHDSSKNLTFITFKYLFSATSLMLYYHEWRHKSESINQLFNDLIVLLVQLSKNSKSNYQEAGLQCLYEIASINPELINETNNSLTTNISQLYTLILLNNNGNVSALREIIENITFDPDFKFYHLCSQIFAINSHRESLSLIVLKPFLQKFIFSNEIHNIHLALKLLFKFGFEIFSSFEEELFLKQLVILSTQPSLPIGYRLLCLSFTKIAYLSIFKAPLISPPLGLLNSLHPYMFDGPDSQEKKLNILNEFSFVVKDEEFFRILSRLYELSAIDSNISERATNSLFRIIYVSLKKRHQLTDSILKILLEKLFSLSQFHYIHKLFIFLKCHWKFAQNIVDKFIAQLMIISKETNDSELANTSQIAPLIRNYNQFLSFLHFINWFLSIAHHNIQLTEFQLEFIVCFIRKNCNKFPQYSTLALTCCTSILYYQRVTPKVKDSLLSILEWLNTETDIQTSSLAQVYLLALRTLGEEYIKHVFTSDEEEFLAKRVTKNLGNIVKNDVGQCPLSIERVLNDFERQTINTNKLSLGIKFNIYLPSTSTFDHLFCINVKFTSPQIDTLMQTANEIPLLEKGNNSDASNFIQLNFDFKINDRFQLDISVKFVDSLGTVYNFHKTKSELILLEDIFIPINVNGDDNLQTMLKRENSLKTVISVSNYSSFDLFFKSHPWLIKFVNNYDCQHKKPYYHFIIGLSPDRLIMGTIKIINGFVNIYIKTNDYQIIPSLYYRLKCDTQ